MLADSPIARQNVGRTFTVALSMLIAIGATELGFAVWGYVNRLHMPSIAANSSTAGTPAKTAAAEPEENPDFAANPLTAAAPTVPVGPTATAPKTAEQPEPAKTEPPATTTTEPTETIAIGMTPPKPTPLPVRAPGLPEPEQSARYKETLETGRRMRERGDMGNALTRFREASAMDAKSPEAMYEIALTLEKMQLPEKAAEQWRRIHEMGEPAGPYYVISEARLNQATQTARREAGDPTASPLTEPEEGIAPGKVLGLLPVATEEHDDKSSAKHLTLRIPIKARGPRSVEVRDLTIQVLFYDIVDKSSLVQTTANVSSRWNSAPADWLDSNTETLEVDYQLPHPEGKGPRRENRQYFGYLIRIYYRGELQAAAGAPEKLEQQFPPEQRLPDPNTKK